MRMALEWNGETALSPGAEEGEEEVLAADSVPAAMPGLRSRATSHPHRPPVDTPSSPRRLRPPGGRERRPNSAHGANGDRAGRGVRSPRSMAGAHPHNAPAACKGCQLPKRMPPHPHSSVRVPRDLDQHTARWCGSAWPCTLSRSRAPVPSPHPPTSGGGLWLTTATVRSAKSRTTSCLPR
jgi:hypothetical protein